MATIINISLIALFLLVGSPTITAQWSSATAIFYEGDDGGACGYPNGLFGTASTALSDALFQKGQTCGACYEVQCVNSESCLAGKTTQVTATNFCPSNGKGGWCDGSKQHFDMNPIAFTQIAQKTAGEVPIQHRRVPCIRSGAVTFTISGNPDFNLVSIRNVAGAGDIKEAFMKGSGDWCMMTRNYGASWQCASNLVGQSLSFKVTLSDGNSLEFDNVAPANWQFGQTFTSSQNF